MSMVYCPVCIDCKHRIRENKPKDTAFCKAYPNGIPYEIWKEKSKPNIDKNTPCPNGYRFEHD